MLVLGIILVPTISVNAKSYVADDSVTISSQYHDVFNNYFKEYEQYTYFPYECHANYSRTCYFGINSKGNYLDISYKIVGNSYELQYKTGVDEDFSVTGVNVFVHEPSMATLIACALVFIFLVYLICLLIQEV